MSTPLGSSQWMYSSGEEVTQQSLKFNDDESQYLSWTPAAAGSLTTWTWSGWVKRGNLAAGQPARGTIFGRSLTLFGFFNPTSNAAADNFGVYLADGEDDRFMTNRVFRDTSSWYHFVVVLDTTNSTAGDRFRLYVNGVRETSFSRADAITQNRTAGVNAAAEHGIGRQSPAASQYFDGCLSDIHFIDGQALDASSFGQFTDGYWEAKDYAGTYGTNGFHLTFEDDVVSEGFNAVTYRGTGADQSISGLGFEPDLVWSKRRDTSQSHSLFDTVRGAQLALYSDYTGGDDSLSSSLLSFDSDGFTVGSGNGAINNSGGSYVSWAWDAGSGSPVSNTDGSITSTVKANPSYGFSITSYTGNGTAGATVGHGLSSAPDMMIVKGRNTTAAQAWRVYHKDSNASPASGVLNLNTTGGFVSSSTQWNNTVPTSSVFSVGTDPAVNENTKNYIAYLFNSVAGYSSIGSYSGTGSAVTVTTGFKPAFLLLKNANDGTASWIIFDNTRNPANPADLRLDPNASDAESTFTNGVDFDATSFTINATGLSQSGDEYIYMAFADTREAAFWKDVSGQGNHWTPNNLDYRDSLIDSPANNFATFNSIHTDNTITLSEGNLKIVHGTDSGVGTTFGFNPSDATGYYAEFYKIVGSYGEIGIAPTNISDLSKPATAGKNGYVLYLNSGQKANNGSYTTYGSTVAAGDIVSVAVKDGKIWWGVNGVWIAGGDPENGTNPAFSGISGEYFFIQAYDTNAGTALQTIANFGQDSTFSGARPAGGNQDANGIGDFAYAPPSGYLALCTANLPTPTIIDGSEHFNTVLWTGTSATQSITGFNHTPELLWTKARSNASNHGIIDIVRGTNKLLFADDTSAEYTQAIIDSFDSDGFTTTIASSLINLNGYTYAGWGWKAGGTAVSNTAGSITSQVSANVDAGFSIVSYTGNGTSGATIGHGLSSAPDVLLVKRRSAANDWQVYHSANTSTPETDYLILNQTLSTIDTAATWNDTAPTSSVFTVGSGTGVNNSGDTYICYAFHSVDGYLKAGSYTGNGSSDGPFVYTGFRPAWIMTKRTNTTGEWWISDTARDPDNAATSFLWSQSSGAEASSSSYAYDILSNGFKLRTTYGDRNGSGSTFIYLAFAEHPFKYANAR